MLYMFFSTLLMAEHYLLFTLLQTNMFWLVALPYWETWNVYFFHHYAVHLKIVRLKLYSR